MEIIISGRHLTVSDELRQHIEEKLGKIENQHFKITSVRVVLDVVRSQAAVEMHLHGKDLNLDAHGEDADMYAAIDIAAGKLSAQIHKHWEKVRKHHGHPSYRDIEAVERKDEEPKA